MDSVAGSRSSRPPAEKRCTSRRFCSSHRMPDPPSPYPPIADYAIIGCTRSAALISREGSIDWLCWPRFDSPSIFARILDSQKGGHFSIRPAGQFKGTRRYLPDTNVLETTFESESGVVRMLDL